jgi:hypothetical protein
MSEKLSESSATPIDNDSGAGAFEFLVVALEQHMVDWHPLTDEASIRPTSRTAQLREALRVHGTQNARELAARTDIPVPLVSALLKHDIQTGRIRVERGVPGGVSRYTICAVAARPMGLRY